MPGFGTLQDTIGDNRAWALFRIVLGIVYFGLIGWLLAGAAFVIATVYLIGDLALKLALNRRMEFLRPWAKSTVGWNYQLVMWIFGLTEWPGWMGWTPANYDPGL